MTTLGENVRVFATRAEMGDAAGMDIADELRRRLASQDRVRMVFAAAPSQSEALAALMAADGIDWSRVEAFHMDEYLGLQPGRPELFGEWLTRNVFGRVPFGEVHLLDPSGDPENAAADYARRMTEAPIDIVVCGIGENGHIAFNDPPVADLTDPLDVKVVELDEACRTQQVNDGAFPTFDDVPTHAVTLTVPRILRSDKVFCIVPGPTKTRAVTATFTHPLSTAWPSTALRTHPSCSFYFDADSARDLQ